MISDDRLSHLASLVAEGLWKDDLVDYTDEDVATRVAKRATAQYGKQLREIDQKARGMLTSLKRGVPEGSPEWDVLYQKYFEEEASRRGY